MHKIFLPGSKIGVIGGGQLGRMFALEAKKMGYFINILDNNKSGPAAEVADKTFSLTEIDDFISSTDVATYEFENIDLDAAKYIEKNIPLYPSTNILEIKKNRISEKTFLKQNNLPVPNFYSVENGGSALQLIEKNKLPLVIKTAYGGYDGKGQYHLKNHEDIEHYKNEISTFSEPLIVEDFVDFKKEVSIMCARNERGKISLFPISENTHVDGILNTSILPVNIGENIEGMIQDIASKLVEALDLIGIIGIEIFVTKNDEVLINEFAPRVHNSGHYSLDGCKTSQFEQLLRCICNLPFGSTELISNVCMLNIIGKSLDDLPIEKILSINGVKFHWYGKSEVRVGRKMGHINILGKNTDEIKNKLNLLEKLVYP